MGLAAIAVACQLALAVPAHAEPWFGFSDNAVRAHLISADKDALWSARTKATMSRVHFDWRAVEYNRGSYNWSEYDEIYQALTARGIKVLWMFSGSPQWAWDLGTLCTGADCPYPPARTHLDDWKRMVQAVAQRYPNSAIEVWNEPNLYGHWRPRPDPARYVELLKATYTAVKAVRPSMPVILGGLSNLAVSGNGNMSLRDFLTAVYANGAKGYMDGVSFHPYPASLNEEEIQQNFDIVRSIRNANGDSATRLWLTEYGTTTTGTTAKGKVTEQKQAWWDTHLYWVFHDMPDVAGIFVHTLIESSGLGREVGFGVMRQTLVPKPAFCNLADARGSTYRCPF